VIVSALEMRWKRALRIDACDVKRNSAKPSEFWVRSQSHPSGGYMVALHFTQAGHLKEATCSCPDFCKEVHPLAMPMLHDVRVCKHILAAARVATEERA